MATFRTEITAESSQYNAAMEAAEAKAKSVGQAMAAAMRQSTREMGDGFRQANDRIWGELGRTDSLFSHMRSSIVATGAAAGVAFSAAGLVSFTSKAIDAVAAFDDLSEKTSLSVELLSKLDAVAVIGGHSIDGVAGNASKFAKSVAEALGGNKELLATFAAMNIQLRDADGKMRSIDDLYVEYASKIANAENGTIALAYALRLSGKSASELIPFYKDLAERGLGVARVTTEQAAAAEKYQKDMKGLTLEFDNFKIATANKMIPALNAIAKAMKDTMGETNSFWASLRAGIATFLTGDDQYKNDKALTEQVETLLKLERQLAVYTDTYGKDDYRTQATRQSVENYKALIATTMAYRKELEKSTAAEAAAAGGAPKVKLPPPPGGAGDPKSPASRMPDWESDLKAERDAYEKRKLEQGSFERFSVEMERDYWKAKLVQTDLSAQEVAAITGKWYDAEREIRKRAFDAELEDLRGRAEAFRKGSTDRIQIAGDAAVKIGLAYGLESKEYKAALADMSRAARERADEQRRLDQIAADAQQNASLAGVALERQRLDTLENLGAISAEQKLVRLRELLDEEFNIRLRAAERNAELLSMDEIAHAQAMERIAELRRKYDLDRRKIEDEQAIESKKAVDRWMDPIASATQQMVNGVLQGTQTARQLANNMLQNLALSYAQTLVKMGIDWVKTEVLKTQATTAGVAARTSAEAAGAGQSTLIQAGTAIQNIGTKAWEAAANVYTAISSIPGVGPFLAPAMAAAASVAVLGFAKNVMSAAGGYDIPAGVNPMTQLHEKEMVLPARIAEPLRQNLEAGGGGFGGGGAVHFHIAAMDARGVAHFLRRNQVEMADAARSTARRFISRG